MRNGVIRKHKVKSKDERVQNNVWSQIIIITESCKRIEERKKKKMFFKRQRQEEGKRIFYIIISLNVNVIHGSFFFQFIHVYTWTRSPHGVSDTHNLSIETNEMSVTSS